jgi:hypothetical protein
MRASLSMVFNGTANATCSRGDARERDMSIAPSPGSRNQLTTSGTSRLRVDLTSWNHNATIIRAEIPLKKHHGL